MRLIDADATLEQMKGMNMLFSPKIVIDNMPTINTEQIRADAIDDYKKKIEFVHEWILDCEVLDPNVEIAFNTLIRYAEHLKKKNILKE